MDTKELIRFAKLSEVKSNLEAKLDRVKAKMALLEPHLLDQLTDAQINQLKLAGGHTIYIRRQIWATISDRPSAIEALKEAGMEDYVAENFNSNSLSAYVRETLESGEDLPDSFEGVIGHTKKATLRSVRST
jgi:response regulator RpfG family c-di-GMP phosphodiesterase